MKTTDNKKGFTIIEVVLVLAIAALIFLMVFVAYPALSRGQRDTQRKNDLSRAQTAITNATTSNRGNAPEAALENGSFIDQYLTVDGDEFVDPSGKEYVFREEDQATPPSNAGNPDSLNQGETEVRIWYTIGGTCDLDGAVKTGQGDRKVALRLPLEGGGVACVNT